MMAIVILIAKMMALANQKEVEVAWDEHHDVDNNDDDDDGDDGDDDDDDDDDGDDDDDDDYQDIGEDDGGRSCLG